MGMLGHHHPPAEAPNAPVEEEVDEESKKVIEVQGELCITELTAEGTELSRRVEILGVIKDRVETALNAGGTGQFQRAVLPGLIGVLTAVPPKLEDGPDSPENKLRISVVELLGRLPISELPKEHYKSLLDACHALLVNDHEENGMVAQRVAFDIHKVYKSLLENQSGAFFDWLEMLYKNFPESTTKQLEIASNENAAKVLVPSKESLKLTSEVALMIVFLLQSYPNKLKHYAPILFPLMVEAVNVVGPLAKDVPPSAMKVATDFRMAQIKTLAFLTIIARSPNLTQIMSPHKDTLCGALVWLMQAVPDVLPVRKELMGCMRNILNTGFRSGLQSKIDLLLDEKVLLGSSRACRESLRSMAFTNLAELVAASKGELSLEQLQRVVRVYAKNAHDCTLPQPLQMTSIRLLYNLIEVVFHRRADQANCEAYRALLSRILDCMVSKLGALRDQAPRYITELKQLEEARKVRKAAEAATVAAIETEAKQSMANRRKELEKRAKEAQEAQVAAAAAAAAAAAVETPAVPSGAGADSAEQPVQPGLVEGTSTAPQDCTAPAGDVEMGDAAEEKKEPEAQQAVPENADTAAAPAIAAAAAGDAVPMEEDAKESSNPVADAPATADASAAPDATEKEGNKPAEDEHGGAAKEEAKPREPAAEPLEPFRTLLPQVTTSSTREKDVMEYKSLLQSVLSCLKNVIFTTVAFHTNRGLPVPLQFTIPPWNTRPQEIRSVSHVLKFGLPALSFFQPMQPHANFDVRELFADLFTVLADGRDFTDIFAPRMAFLYETVLANPWYMRIIKHLIDGDTANRTYVNRYMISCVLRYLVAEKLDTLEDIKSPEGKLTLELLEMCFDALHRIQNQDAQKASQLAQQGVPSVERVVLPHVVAFLKDIYPRYASSKPHAVGYARAIRSLFFALTSGKFLEIQSAVGASGLHVNIVETALAVMQGPAARTKEAEEEAAELCLLVPARLEHLIPVLPRMMHAAVRALKGSDRAVSVALKVLDLWVDSFNPEFIEKSMAAVIDPLMSALWSHIRPPPHAFGTKVAEMLGKMGGRSRRWLGEGTKVEYKLIPEYGLRVILAFPPHTSFLVPLDRCVQLAWTTIESATADVHRRKNALRLLQICVTTLVRLQLPTSMMQPPVPASERTTAAPAAASTGHPDSLAGDALGRLEGLLFGGAKPPQIPSELYWPPELGVKTKKQHAAERQMLETVLTAMLASAAVDTKLEGAGAKEFAEATCRHFALLFSAGWSSMATPPSAPPSSRVVKYAALGGVPAMVATLKHLHPHVLLDAIQQGLKENSSEARQAVVDCMCVFVDTLISVGQVQDREDAQRAKQTADAGEDESKQDAEKKEPTSDIPAAGNSSNGEAKPRYLSVISDLMVRAIHCCYGDTWASRLGGVLAMEALAKRMPPAQVLQAGVHATKALFAVLRSLPENAVQEQQEITNILLNILRRALELPQQATDGSDMVNTDQKEAAAATTPGDDGKQTSGGDQKDSEAMEVDQEEEPAPTTTRRSKRGARATTSRQPPKKKQQRQGSADEEQASPKTGDAAQAKSGGADTAAGPANAADATATTATPARESGKKPFARGIQESLLQAVLSGKSNDAVRSAATSCLQLFANVTGTTVGAILGQLLDKMGHVMERRLIPLKAISSQTSYSFSMAYLIRTCPEQLPLTSSIATFVYEACLIMEMGDDAITQTVSVRGQPPKTDVIGKLRIACMEVLVAALCWQAFRETDMQVTPRNREEPAFPLSALRDRIMKIFISQLGSQHERVVILAAEGVKVILDKNLLSKPVLQEALRPILTHLTTYNLITLGLLRHLHRLLDLLSSQFNVTLGEKLIEHLRKWVEVETYIHPQNPHSVQVAWEPGTEWEVAAGMMDVLHKLPPQASRFLHTHEDRWGLVTLTIALEQALQQLPGVIVPSKLWSPYRAPLTRFLNRYPEESVKYFLNVDGRLRLGSGGEYMIRLLDIIRNPLGKPLLEALAQSTDQLAEVLKLDPSTAANEEDAKAFVEAQFNCIHLIRAICKLLPDWLPRPLYDLLLTRWRSAERAARSSSQEDQTRDQMLESKRLAFCLLNFIRRNHDEFPAIFDLVTVFSSNTGVDFSFLKNYVALDLAREFSVEEKRDIFKHWISLYLDSSVSEDDRINMLKYLVNPLVSWTLTHGQHDMFTPDLVSAVVGDIFAHLTQAADASVPNEYLQVEVIQLCSTIVQYSPQSFADHKKELISHLWWTLKNQDSIAKAYAFLCVSYFFRAFPNVGELVIMKAFVNMVRLNTHDAASRDAIRQAVDVMIPTLASIVERTTNVPETDTTSAGSMETLGSLDLSPIPSNASGKKYPAYALRLRQVISEDGYTSSVLVHILQMIVRNRDLFYSSRSLFVPSMINNLTRLGLPGQSALENRILSVDLAATLLWWDGKAAEEQAMKKGQAPMETDAEKTDKEESVQELSADTATENGSQEPTRLTREMDDMVVNFLLRMAFVSCEVRDRDETGWRKLHLHCLEVLRDAARLRPAASLKMHYFEKFLQSNLQQQQQQAQQAQQSGQALPDASPALVTGLRIANIFMEFQPDNFVNSCASQLAMMMDPALSSKHRTPVELLATVMRLLFSAYPPGVFTPGNTAALAVKLQNRMQEVIVKYLNFVIEQQTLVAEHFLYACNCLSIMRATLESNPDCMQQLMLPLVKAMQRVAKDHNQSPQAGILLAKVQAAREVPSEMEHGSGSWFMYHALNVAVPSALVLSAEHRKLFLSTLVMLITGQSVRAGQTDPAIMFTILDMMRSWLLSPKPAHLTPKEFLVLIQRLAQVERMHAIPLALKTSWDDKFLDLLYRVITTKREDDFGNEVFSRVERTFCCGLQSNDPETRQKFFRLYSDRLPRDLYDRLRYIIQIQDWDFLAHTFWLKHAVALLFDCLHMRDPITLAYNSAHVPPLFDYKESMAFPGPLQQALTAQARTQQGTGATGAGTAGGPPSVKQEPASTDAATQAEGKTDGPVSIAEGSGEAGQVDASKSNQDAAGTAPMETTETAGQASAEVVGTGSGRSEEPKLVLDIDIPEELRDAFDGHLKFLAKQNSLRSDSLVSCLIEQVQTDPAVAHHLWVLLFPIVWTSLQKDQQTGLAKPIIQLLSKEHHLRQALLRPTVGQTLLEGICMSQPQPKIPAEMIKYMGRHFHAWHTAVSMLESHVGLFPNDMRCFDAVCDLYSALGEEDMLCGLWQRRAESEETRTAVALQQHGYLPQAQSLYLEMMSRGVADPHRVVGVTKSEMVLWHNQYLSCCMELNQWETVMEYAKAADNSALQLEAAAKNHDWAHLKQTALPKAQVEDGPEFTMIRAQLTLQEMQIMDVDKHIKQALMQCVQRWWSMPESSPWSYAPVLHSFQRAVELQESWRIMMEFSMQGAPTGLYQELKDVCDTWKLRTPNEWEPVRWWSDVLTWRNQVYNMTIRQFANMQATAPTLHQMGYRDKAWSVNRLGHIARLHHLPDACVHMINTLYGFNAMEVQEAFVKVQEQGKAYMLRSEEHLHGLNLINSTNMDYFQPPHQAEMICLKAQFLHLLGEEDPAHKTFSEALTLWSLCPDAWVAWARFCDDRYVATGVGTFLEYAGCCYSQGIRLSNTEAKMLVPRLLQLLMLDHNGAEVIGRTLTQQAAELPAWVWLPWIPQLLTSLQRPEMGAARRVLGAAAIAYPQLMYWHIRPAMQHLKEIAVHAVAQAKAAKAQQAAAAATAAQGDAAAGAGAGASAAQDGKADNAAKPAAAAEASTSTGAAAQAGASSAAGGAPAPGQPDAAPSPQIEKPIEVMSYEAGKEIYESIRMRFSMWQPLEAFICELSSRFTARTDERLLAVIHTLQMRTYKTPLPPTAEVPDNFKRELSGVCKACGSKDPSSAASTSRIAQYQLQFARDLDPTSANAPRTLGELCERLKGWRVMLETVMEDLYPVAMRMENESLVLVDMSLEDLEMPCQPLPTPESPDPVYVEKVGSRVEVIRRNCVSSRRIILHGSDGSAHAFLIVGLQSHGGIGVPEERINALLRSANGLLDKHPESRRRGLRFVAPQGMAIYPVRLIEDDPSATPYLDAWETHCARYGREPDAPIVTFKVRTCNPEGANVDASVRLQAYEEIVTKIVTENVFSQYMYKTMVENSRMMWAFKKQFSLSTAMSAVACEALLLGGRSPGRLLVSRATGAVSHVELATGYDSRFQLERSHEAVPFRLTRNMHVFIGPHGFEGTLVAAGTAAAQGLQQLHSTMPSMLALFLRDDILSWAMRRTGAKSIVQLNLRAQQLDQCVNGNVNACMSRLAHTGPNNSVTVAGNPQAGMRELVTSAINPQNLCRMEPTWQPWL